MTVYPVPLISKPGIVYWVHDADDITDVAKLAGDKRHNIAVLVDARGRGQGRLRLEAPVTDLRSAHGEALGRAVKCHIPCQFSCSRVPLLGCLRSCSRVRT